MILFLFKKNKKKTLLILIKELKEKAKEYLDNLFLMIILLDKLRLELFMKD